jgi:hypothetical protein
MEFPQMPFVLLSSLAEGADRLVARVALWRVGMDQKGHPNLEHSP